MMYKWILAADGVLAMALVVAGLTGHSALAVTLAAVLVAGLLLAYLTVARTMRSVRMACICYGPRTMAAACGA